MEIIDGYNVFPSTIKSLVINVCMTRLHVLFKSILVILGRWAGDNGKLYAMKRIYDKDKTTLRQPRTAR